MSLQATVKKAATIQDVAKSAEVSTATVSRALSNPDIVTEATREAVMKAVRETGYRANRAARNLRTQRAGAIGVLVPNLSNPYYSRVLAGIQSVFAKTDYSVLITDTFLDIGERHPDEWILTDGRADGLLVMDSARTAVTQAILANAPDTAPVVFCNEIDPNGVYTSVASDDQRGAELAAEHLCELGHTRLAIVTGQEGHSISDLRERAFVARAKALGAQSVEVLRGDFSLTSGDKLVPEILSMSPRPTGVFCCSDLMALAVLSTALQSGVKVPQEMSVVGYDDIAVSEYFVPALTTIRQDRTAIGAIAARSLLNRLEKGAISGPADAMLMPVELVKRNSTARLSS